MARAKARITRSFSLGSIAGSATMPALPPPWARPAAAFLKVIARASRKTSRTVTSGAMRMPPIEGPQATLSMTRKPRTPARGSWTRTTCEGPRSSASSRWTDSMSGTRSKCARGAATQASALGVALEELEAHAVGLEHAVELRELGEGARVGVLLGLEHALELLVEDAERRLEALLRDERRVEA